MALTSATAVPARLARTPDDYARIGIEPRAIKLWEDGMRTDGSRGTYEWWYFDAHLDDGAKLVVVFLTKEMTDLKKPLSPSIRIDLTLPDGNSVRKLAGFTAETFSAEGSTSCTPEACCLTTSRAAERATSMATFPPPMTITFFPMVNL